jgi:uncharacterized protein (TIGR03086 family)
MATELLDLYRQASEWTAGMVAGANDLDAPTTCDDWQVRDLLNHMLATQRYFVSAARGEDAAPPGPTPPSLLTSDPAADFEQARTQVLEVFGRDGVIEKTGPSLGIAFSDLLLHGWDLAMATNQDTTMPEGLPRAAYEFIHGRFTEDQRQGVFKPEIAVAKDATAQQRLLGYTGRDPA